VVGRAGAARQPVKGFLAGQGTCAQRPWVLLLRERHPSLGQAGAEIFSLLLAVNWSSGARWESSGVKECQAGFFSQIKG